MSNEIQVFSTAVKEQMGVLTSTGLSQDVVNSKLISFAYSTKKMIEAMKKPYDLSNLDKQSIKEAFKASIDTGLDVDERQLAYVVKYGDKIQFKPSYKGYIYLLKEIYKDAVIKAECVFKGDIFTVERQDGNVKYSHKLANPFATTKDIAGVYAYIEYMSNGHKMSFIETMGKEEIDRIKGKAQTAMVWNEWYGEMAKKAVIRRLCKGLCIGNPKIAKLDDIDNQDFNLRRQEPVDIDYSTQVDMPETKIENKAEVKEDKQEEAIMNTYVIKIATSETRTSKTGKNFTLWTLVLDNGEIIKTFDNQEYKEGQTVELQEVEESEKYGKTAKKVVIL